MSRANGEELCVKGLDGVPYRSSRVEHILIRKSSITAAAVRAMSDVCQALRSFEYVRDLLHMYDTEIRAKEVLQAMLPHAATLASLYLNFDDDT